MKNLTKIFIVFLICVLFCGMGHAQVKKTGNTDQQFEFSNISFKVEGYPSTPDCHMIGEVKNISGEDISTASFRVSFYDGSNKLLEDDVTPGISNFKNGETRSFEGVATDVSSCQFGNYKIDTD